MEAVNVVEARKKFSELVARVAFGGSRVIVERRGVPMAALISIDDLKRFEEMERGAVARRERGQAALAKARAAREAILAERGGEYLPNSAELIEEMREERDNELDSLR